MSCKDSYVHVIYIYNIKRKCLISTSKEIIGKYIDYFYTFFEIYKCDINSMQKYKIEIFHFVDDIMSTVD